MKILVVQEYGIGNLILTTPLIRVLSREHHVDIIVSSNRVAGWLIINMLTKAGCLLKDNPLLFDMVYDYVLYCHPPGRIRPPKGQFRHQRVIPTDKDKQDKKYPFRFSEHEVTACLRLSEGLISREITDEDMQLYCESQPPTRFTSDKNKVQVAIGIGYLKDHPWWRQKHWGNFKYVQLIQELKERGAIPVLVGDHKDQKADGEDIQKRSGCKSLCGTGLGTVLSVIMGSDYYIGNDSGLMHVAAAYGKTVIGIFREGISNPIKNKPWCSNGHALVDPTVADVLEVFGDIDG